jgi:precorrin-6A synthase
VLGILVWGDPALYDSTLRVIALMRTPVEVTVVPGITAPQTLAAQHAVTWNRIAGAVHVTTGRRLREEGMTADDVIVMLDSQSSFLGLDPSVEIYWGAYLGTPDEILLSGTVGSIGSQIEKVRAEARAEHGWIMDTYLLRRP